MAAEDTTYNGWSNYPTWAVNLWLSNDEVLYNDTRDLVAAIASVEDSMSSVWTLEESHRFTLADRLKDWVRDELAPDLGATFSADLLGYAFDQVNWEEIANSWINDSAEAL